MSLNLQCEDGFHPEGSVCGRRTHNRGSIINYVLPCCVIVSMESIRIALTIAALNSVDFMSCNLDNAYLDAMCCENIWFKGGTECEEDKGKVLIFVRALYGLKSVG